MSSVDATFEILAKGQYVQPQKSHHRTREHDADIAEFEAAGFEVIDEGTRVSVNVSAFRLLKRCDFDTVSPGTDPAGTNCWAYYRPDGAWYISLFGRAAEQEKPGWHNNSHGYASFFYPGHKPIIDLSTDSESTMVDKCLVGLASAPGIYQRLGALFRIETGSPSPSHVLRAPDTPTLQPLPVSAIHTALDDSCDFKKFDVKSEKLKKSRAPERLAKKIGELGSYPKTIPTIESIAKTPRFLADGTILHRKGFHEATGIFYMPESTLHFGDLMKVPEAIALLDGVIADFPFQRPEHKTLFYSGIFSILARPAYIGATPMHLIEGNVPAVGKGLKADCIAEIAMANTFPRLTIGGEEEELRKTITSIVIAGDPAILLDNLKGKLDSGSLDALLTSEKWQGRRLGLNKTISMPWAGIIFATSNNLQMTKDTCRRCVWARMESRMENPEVRSDVTHKRLLVYVRENRGKLVTAALSILRQWHLAGRPHQAITPWGSFEGWSDVVRQAMVWADIGDPAETRIGLQQSNDTETQLLRMLIAGWQEADPGNEGMSCKEAVERSLAGAAGQMKFPLLHDAIDELPGRSDPKNLLGHALKKFREVVCDGKWFVKRDGRTTVWRLAQ